MLHPSCQAFHHSASVLSVRSIWNRFFMLLLCVILILCPLSCWRLFLENVCAVKYSTVAFAIPASDNFALYLVLEIAWGIHLSFLEHCSFFVLKKSGYSSSCSCNVSSVSCLYFWVLLYFQHLFPVESQTPLFPGFDVSFFNIFNIFNITKQSILG